MIVGLSARVFEEDAISAIETKKNQEHFRKARAGRRKLLLIRSTKDYS